MKIVELKLEAEKTGEGITAISLVKNPAIEQNWIAFSQDDETPSRGFKANKEFAFKTIDAEQRIIAGPAMVPDKLIYRIDGDGEEFFVFFNKSTIRDLSERFLLQGKQNNVTLEHESTLNDLSVVESWIVEDAKLDKSTMYGFDLPVGSWFVKMKVLNDDVWNLVKENSVSGFSVEGVFTSEIIKNQKTEMKNTKLDGYLDKIRGLFTDETPETKEKSNEKFGTVEAEGNDGVIAIQFPGEVLEVGAAITHLVDDVETPVPTGEYKLSDGTILVVVEDGIVGELKPVEPAEETEAEEMESDGLKGEQIDTLVNGIAEIIANFQTQVKKDMADAIEKSAATLRTEFNKPAATVEDETPEDVNKTKIVRGLNKFIKDEKK